MSSFQEISPKSSPPPGETGLTMRPPQPTWTPPPPPTKEAKGKGTWRPSGAVAPPVVTPPSPPSEDQALFPRRSSGEILERISPHTPRRSEDVPRTKPWDVRTQEVTVPPRQIEEISPVSTTTPAVESGEISPVSTLAPVAQDVAQDEAPDQVQPPTFAESQEAYGHTNPLLAHPVSEPTSHAPPEKMPIDDHTTRSRSQSRTSIDFPSAVFPARKPVPGPSNTLPVAASASSSSTSIPSNSTGNLVNISSINSLPASTTTISGPSSHRIQGASKPGFFSQLGHKTTSGLNNLAHKFGGTGFLPDTLDNECEKAALILKTFCKNGVYADTSKSADQQVPPLDGQSSSSSVTQKRPTTLVTIPTRVIQKAVGLAIFTTFRAGLQFKGSTGSGILVARRNDGTWTGPSAIQLTSVGGGMVVGLDIYDCVCVINTQESLNAFMDSRVSIGADIAVVAGPWGAGGSVEWGALKDEKKSAGTPTNTSNPTLPSPPVLEVNGEPAKVNEETRKGRPKGQKKFSTCYSYVKSRGFYAGFGYEGTMMTERKAANTSFYGEMVTAEQILRDQVTPPEDNPSLQALWDVLRGAEGLTPMKSSSTEAIFSPPEIVEPVEAPGDDEITPAPMPPPSYPVDSLHPMEAYKPEKN